jgi:hypothetical protein
VETVHREATGAVPFISHSAIQPASLLRKSIGDLRPAASAAADRDAIYKLRAISGLEKT